MEQTDNLAQWDSLLVAKVNLGLNYEFWPAQQLGSRPTMLVLHGRGDVKESFHWLPAAIGRDDLNFIFLDAPDPYGSGHSWYDLPPKQGPGIIRSRKLLENVLSHIIHTVGLKPTEIYLCGFSQGALMSIDVGLRSNHILGGVVALSGYVFFMEEYPQAFSKVATQQKFFVAHGQDDEVLPIENTKKSVEQLRAHGISIDFREYANLAHSIDEGDELSDIQAFISKMLEVC